MLQSAFSSLPLADEEHILACARVLQACAVSVWLEDCIRLQCESLPRRAKQYITAHLMNRCPWNGCVMHWHRKNNALFPGKKQYGCTAGEMIRNARWIKPDSFWNERIYRFVHLQNRLRYDGYNYFTRLFRKHTGETPTAYRRRLRREAQ